MDIASELSQDETLLFYYYFCIVSGLLVFVVSNTHIDYLIAKCVVGTSIQIMSDKSSGTLVMAGNRLFRFLKWSFVFSVIGTISYAMFSLFQAKEWFPVWLLYVCAAICFPAQAVHYSFELLFQMNLTEVLNVTRNMSAINSSMKTMDLNKVEA
jgi:hypothetical protein